MSRIKGIVVILTIFIIMAALYWVLESRPAFKHAFPFTFGKLEVNKGNYFSGLSQHGKPGTNKTRVPVPEDQVLHGSDDSIGLLRHTNTCSNYKSDTMSSTPHRLCINNLGRLGNQMFQYAAIYGLAIAKGMCPLVYGELQIVLAFQLTARRYQDPHFCDKFIVVRNLRDCAFDEQSTRFTGNRDVLLSGYYQSHLYFSSYGSEIRDQFAFKKRTLQHAGEILCDTLRKKLGNDQPCWNQTRTYVGIHVRRGDTTNSSYYNVAPKNYFDKARTDFRANYYNVLFVVCSDDINWCKDNLASNDTVFVSAGGPVLDMAVLSMMNHTIISIGSFGFWAAFLAGGATIYYKHPVKPRSSIRIMYSENMTDYYYPHWIPME